MKIDPKLKEWATPRQCEIIDAVNEHGSQRKAAKALGQDQRSIERMIVRIKRSAAMRGYAPEGGMVHAAPDPFVVKGTSTYYDERGNVKGQWVKTQLDRQQVKEAIAEAIAGLLQDVPKQRPTKVSADKTKHDLANLYTLTDTHIGMKAWAAETGADWDLEIAEQVLYSAALHLIESTPHARTGIVNFLGDLMHFDSLDAVTPQHRNLLDADSRYPKVVAVAVRILRSVVNAALNRHEQVVLSIQEGNHDLASTVWIRQLFATLYEDEPRVTVCDDVTPYSVVQHGKTMIAFHHGHLAKNEQLPMIFAATFPKMWGDTEYRYCHVGHRHHVDEKEHAGMTVIQHPTIAARDAYAARGGWIAQRAMTAITYHAEYGQVARATVTPEMLQ